MRRMKISGTYVKFFMYLLVAVLANIAGTTLFFRVDLTRDRVFSLSEASRKVVSTLSEPLTVNVFFTRNLPAPHNATERYLRDLMAEYALHGNRFFSYRFYNVNPEEGDGDAESQENRRLAQTYGIHPLQMQHIEKDEVKFQKAYMGMVLIHGDLLERIPAVTSTDGLEYRLTTAINKLNNKVSALLNLPGKIDVSLYLSSSLEAVAPHMRLRGVRDIPEKVERAVTRLNEKIYGKLAFRHIDPTRDPEKAAGAVKHDLLNLRWPALDGGKVPAGKGVVGLVLEYGKKAVTLPLIRVYQIPLIGSQYEMTDLGRIEEQIGESLESLIEINQDIGFLAGHGNPHLFPDPSRPSDGPLDHFRVLASENYTLKEVRLKEEGIPNSIRSLVVAAPKEPFSEAELFEIDQFLMRGNSLALFLDAFREVAVQQPQSPFGGGQPVSYIPVATGIEKLLEHYGIRVRDAYVLDESCFRQQIPAAYGGGERAIYYAPLIKSGQIEKRPRFMESIKGLVAARISPLVPLDDRLRENGITSRLLFSSSEKSWEMAGQINLNPMFLHPPSGKDKFRAFPLAYLLEGEFPSYFAGKPVPKREKEVEKTEVGEKAAGDAAKIEGEEKAISRGKPGKIFLIASSETLTDNLLDRDGRHPNAMFVMNVLDYLNGREDIAVMRGKQQGFNPLADASSGIRTAVKAFNIAGLPVLVILFGLLVWARRHARKRRIQLMFKQQGVA